MKRRPTIFLLDCGGYRPDRNFRRAASACAANAIPVSFALLPARVNQELCDYLRQLQKEASFCSVQYGCKNRAGSETSLKIFKQDMRSSMERLHNFCKNNFAPVFVPPGMSCDADTAAVCDELHFRVLAAGPRKTPFKTAMVHVLFDINLHEACKGKGPSVTSRKMMEMTAAKLEEAPCAGVYFSHANFSQLDLSAFEQYCVLLKKFATEHKVRLALLSELT